MIFRSHLPLFVIVVVALAVAPVSPCAAQGRPSPLGPSITSGQNLSEQQRAQVESYAEYWAAMLKSTSSRPDEVETARAELIRPMSNIQVSDVFRYEYGRIVEPRLREISDNANLHAIVNGMIVASLIGGDRCANFLIDNLDSAFQPKWQIRLQAAQGAVNVMKGDTVEERKMQTLADRLRDAAVREDHPLVLRHQLNAISVADHQPVTAPGRQLLRAKLVQAIVQVVDRMSVQVGKPTLPDPQQTLESLAEAVSNVRDKYLSAAMAAPERAALGKQLAPSLAKMLGAVAADWDAGNADETKQRVYSVIIGMLEGFLPAIDASVRGGTPTQSTMRAAWDGGNKATFESELAKWTAVFEQPQYASGR